MNKQLENSKHFFLLVRITVQKCEKEGTAHG